MTLTWELIHARHECGHALVALLVQGSFRYVTLRPRNIKYGGHTYGIRTPSPRAEAVQGWAGSVAGFGHVSIEERVLLQALAPDVPDVMELGEGSPRAEAEQLVAAHCALLDWLATELIRRRTMTRRDFERAITEWHDSLGTSWAHDSGKRRKTTRIAEQ
jgi:hypothetical protein